MGIKDIGLKFNNNKVINTVQIRQGHKCGIRNPVKFIIPLIPS